MVNSVKQLGFSMLYLGHATLADRYAAVPGAQALPLPASPALQADVALLTAACRQGWRDGRIVHDEVGYRVWSAHTAGGRMFVLSRIAETVQPLAELGVPAAFAAALGAPGLSGLCVVAGPPHGGKTTTACALVRHRLQQHGGLAVTDEQTIELPLEGSHGDGVCYQTAARNGDRPFAQSFRDTLRFGAGVVLVDEIRDGASAAALLQASSAGKLVITTMVAAGVVPAIVRLETMLADHLPPRSARALLADGLAAVLHQQVRGGLRPGLSTQMLMLDGTPQARNLVRNGDYELLPAEMTQQLATLLAGAAPHREAAR